MPYNKPILASEDLKIKTTCPESKYKWSDRQVELLISEWEREPCLYDATHDDYSKSDKRLIIERRIVAALNENVNIPEERLITGKNVQQLQYKSKLGDLIVQSKYRQVHVMEQVDAVAKCS